MDWQLQLASSSEGLSESILNKSNVLSKPEPCFDCDGMSYNGENNCNEILGTTQSKAVSSMSLSAVTAHVR